MGYASYLEDIRDRQAEGLERKFTGGCVPCIGIPTQPRELKNIQQKKTSSPSDNKTLDAIPKGCSEQEHEYQSYQYEQPKEWEYTYRKRNKNSTPVDKVAQEQNELKKQEGISDVDFVQNWESYSSEDLIDLHKPNK